MYVTRKKAKLVCFYNIGHSHEQIHIFFSWGGGTRDDCVWPGGGEGSHACFDNFTM